MGVFFLAHVDYADRTPLDSSHVMRHLSVSRIINFAGNSEPECKSDDA